MFYLYWAWEPARRFIFAIEFYIFRPVSVNARNVRMGALSEHTKLNFSKETRLTAKLNANANGDADVDGATLAPA